MSISVAVLVVSVWMSILVLLVPIPMAVAANTVPTSIPVAQHQVPSISTIEALTQKAEQADKQAQFELADLYFRGDKLPQDKEKGLYWLEKSAQQNECKAQYLLGMLYYQGYMVPKSTDKAVLWLTKAAEHNQPMAQHFLGQLYYTGQGVTQDYQQAFYWIKRSANNGSQTAQLLLAELYFGGTGVEPSDFNGLFWLTFAARRGSVEAAYRAGNQYFKDKKYSQAYTWLKVAELQGEQNAKPLRELIQKHFTLYQIQQAEKEADKIIHKVKVFQARQLVLQPEQLAPYIPANVTKEPTQKTMYDFGPYIQRVSKRIKTNFKPVSTDSSLNSVVVFNILCSGAVTELRLLHPSGSVQFDEVALQAVRAASPFPVFPKQANKQSIQMEFTFDYGGK
jgi:TonB family protein